MIRRIGAVALAALMLLALTGTAHADEQAEVTLAPPPPAPGASPQWYGWQTLLVDGVSLGTIPLEVGSGASFRNDPSASYLFLASVSGYTFGAPIVHAAHGHYRRALLDLGLRAGALTVGSLVGVAAAGAPSSCELRVAGCLGSNSGGLVAGAAIGAALASVIDASFLAWDSHPGESGAPRSFVVTPLAGLTPGGGTAGVVGTF